MLIHRVGYYHIIYLKVDMWFIIIKQKNSLYRNVTYEHIFNTQHRSTVPISPVKDYTHC